MCLPSLSLHVDVTTQPTAQTRKTDGAQKQNKTKQNKTKTIRGLAGVGGWLSMGLAIAAYRRGGAPRRDYEARYGAGPAAAATVATV